MIVTAPDGTPVGIFVGPEGFEGLLIGTGTVYPFFYLNDPTCTTAPYLLASSIPERGYTFLADPLEAFSPSATVWYASPPYGFVGSNATYQIVFNGSANVCQADPLLASSPIGLAKSFPINHPVPFTVSPWVAPDIDPPTQ
jgi:hypothetical protein